VNNSHVIESGKRRVDIGQALRIVLLLVLSILMIFPFIWMLSASFKYDTDVFVYPIQWIPDPVNWSNYTEVWQKVPFLQFYLNTLKLSLVGTLVQVAACAMAAYAFARLRFPGKGIIFSVFIGTMMIPWHAIMIPQYVIVGKLDLINTHEGLILLQIFSGFGIFLLRQFFMGIPMGLSEAASIDGCNHWQTFWKVILPQMKSGLATLFIFAFMGIWNDYLAPLIYLRDQAKYTIQLGLQFFQTSYTMQYGVTMAGMVCALVPIIIIYIFCQKYILEGLSFSGMKG